MSDHQPDPQIVHIPVELPAEHRMGPALKALNDRQRAFVVALVSGASQGKAAQAAGYNGTEEVLRVTGHRLAHDEKVQAAIVEETRKKFRFAAVAAADYLVAALTDAGVKDQDKIKAATAILDRGGLHVLTEHRVTLAADESLGDQVSRVVEVLGRDVARSLLGRMVDDVTDVVPKEADGEA